jgi:hypothetical protein
MRCPYCGGLNSDQAQFCVRCGRDMSKPPAQTTASRSSAPYPPPPQQPQQPPYQNPRQPAPGQGYPRPPVHQSLPTQVPPYKQPSKQTSPAPAGTRASTRRVAETPISPPPPPIPQGPEAPAPFPPHTMQHLKTLEQGALNYSFVSEEESVGRKKTVRILYQRCTPWQQVATLLKALKEYQSDKFNTITIQGIYAQENSMYGFTNGQLQFDRNVRLGSQIMNRYQVETGNGYEADSVRIVLSE